MKPQKAKIKGQKHSHKKPIWKQMGPQKAKMKAHEATKRENEQKWRRKTLRWQEMKA